MKTYVWLSLCIILPLPFFAINEKQRSSEHNELFGKGWCQNFDIFDTEDQDCLSTWGDATTNTCDYVGCVTGNGNNANCGNGIEYSNITERFVVEFEEWNSYLTYYTTPAICTAPITCITDGYDPTKDCYPGHDTAAPGTFVIGNCDEPVTLPPTGCTKCKNGGLDIMRYAQMTYTSVPVPELCPL